MIGTRNGLNFVSDKKSTPPKPKDPYEAEQRAREEILSKARAQYKGLPSETAENAPFKTQDPVVGLYPTADQSELEAIYKQHFASHSHRIGIECFVICEPTYETPFKTVRSRVNGVHLLIWQNNQWELYPELLETWTDHRLGPFPQLPLEEYEAWGTFA